MRVHRYTQWDGTQEVLFPTTDDLLKHLSDHLLEEEGVRRALRDLMRRGFTSEDGQRSVKGMRDFLREADEKRRELLNKYSPDSFKLTSEEQQALSEKLNSLAEKLLEDENFLKNLPSMMDNAVNNLESMLENLDSMTQEQLQQLSDMMSQMQ